MSNGPYPRSLPKCSSTQLLFLILTALGITNCKVPMTFLHTGLNFHAITIIASFVSPTKPNTHVKERVRNWFNFATMLGNVVTTSLAEWRNLNHGDYPNTPTKIFLLGSVPCPALQLSSHAGKSGASMCCYQITQNQTKKEVGKLWRKKASKVENGHFRHRTSVLLREPIEDISPSSYKFYRLI